MITSMRERKGSLYMGGISNNRTEAAATLTAPDALAVLNGRMVVVARGAELLEADGAPLRRFPAEIAFTAELPDDGRGRMRRSSPTAR